jgi:hypothetical protein
MREKANVT